MRALVACLLLSGCASMLQPIPGMAVVAQCEKGVAYSYKQELICDDARGNPLTYRKLEPNETAMSACIYCDGWRFR